jgi:acetyl esterase/lipase
LVKDGFLAKMGSSKLKQSHHFPCFARKGGYDQLIMCFLRLAPILCASLFFSLNAVAQQPPAPVYFEGSIYQVWPVNQMPGKATDKPEINRLDKGRVEIIFNVSLPQMTVFKTARSKDPAPAVIVCPGGGYGVLAYTKEGTEIAEWLNSIGITGIVLKYRIPGRDGAFQDIQRAVRLARFHAQEWNIDPEKIGVIGFSAGGHLSARLSSDFNEPAYPPIDEADKLSCRPDFTVLVYPAYLETKGQLSPELHIGTSMSPMLIIHTEDDSSFIQGSKIYHTALDAAQVTNEYLLFPTGGHGYGLRSNKDVRVWPERCTEWFRKIGILK